MNKIKSKIEHIEEIQKEKLELQERLNETDNKLKTMIDEICLYKKNEDKNLKNNKFYDFYNIFFPCLRNLNTSLAFFGMITTSILFVVAKNDFSNSIFLISVLLGIIPIGFVLCDIVLTILKIKSKKLQALALIFPFIIYIIIIIFIVVELYNSGSVVDKILSVIK